MQRPIKFRAWNTDENKWWYMSLGDVLNLHSQNIALGNIGGSHFDGDKWCQYTGLKDASAVEIYEGDILRFDQGWGAGSFIREVKWDYDMAGFDLGDEDTYMNAADASRFYEVIGNVHENPSLLTRQERNEMSKEQLNKDWRLFKALQDKTKFDALSLEDKLEALRIASQQKREEV